MKKHDWERVFPGFFMRTLGRLIRGSLLFFLGSAFGHVPMTKALDNVVQTPVFYASSEVVKTSSEKIVERVKPLLRSRLRLVNYDRISSVVLFLHHYEECCRNVPDIRPIDAYKSFRLCDKREVSSYGGACVGVAVDLCQALPADLHPYIVLSKLPYKYQKFAFPIYSHAALMIRYENPSDLDDRGVILIDSSFIDLDEPIVVKDNGEIFVCNAGKNGVWSFWREKGEVICEIDGKNPTNNENYLRMVYDVRPVFNPIEASLLPMMLVDRRLSMFSRREDGSHIAQFCVELDRKRIVWDKEGIRFPPISFQAFQNGQVFSSEFVEALGEGGYCLQDKIRKVIDHQETLENLYIEYIRMIEETQDFQITGVLDHSAVQEVLTCGLK